MQYATLSNTRAMHRSAIKALLGLEPDPPPTLVDHWLAFVEAERARAAQSAQSPVVRWAKETFENQAPTEDIWWPWDEVSSQWKCVSSPRNLTD